jgi:hypothetical protein
MSDEGDNRRADWAEQISVAWRKSVEAICAVGRLLDEAKSDLPHGQFEKMVEAELPFGARAARMLAAIGRDDRVRNHGSDMPASWRTLYELTRLTNEQFQAGLKSGSINPEMLRADVQAIAEVHIESAMRRWIDFAVERIDQGDVDLSAAGARSRNFQHLMGMVDAASDRFLFAAPPLLDPVRRQVLIRRGEERWFRK